MMRDCLMDNLTTAITMIKYHKTSTMNNITIKKTNNFKSNTITREIMARNTTTSATLTHNKMGNTRMSNNTMSTQRACDTTNHTTTTTMTSNIMMTDANKHDDDGEMSTTINPLPNRPKAAYLMTGFSSTPYPGKNMSITTEFARKNEASTPAHEYVILSARLPRLLAMTVPPSDCACL